MLDDSLKELPFENGEVCFGDGELVGKLGEYYVFKKVDGKSVRLSVYDGDGNEKDSFEDNSRNAVKVAVGKLKVWYYKNRVEKEKDEGKLRDLHGKLAKAYILAEDIDEGIDYYKGKVEEGPDRGVYHWKLAKLYFIKGDYLLELEENQKGLVFEPENPVFHVGIAVSLWNIDKKKHRDDILSALKTARGFTEDPEFIKHIDWYEQKTK